jgi:glucose-1-phosphate cytidylyltransferase
MAATPMKVVIFCGGLGMRLREHSETIPKALAPVGYRPILWHLMRYYAHFGHREFILCLGYRAEAIKRYFLEYDETRSNDFVLTAGQHVDLLGRDIDDWEITFVDTGVDATLADRLRAVRDHLLEDEIFLANYADVLTDAPLNDLIDQFLGTDATASFLAVRPTNYSFHVVRMDDERKVQRLDDIRAADLWINGGYFIMRREVFDELRPGEELVVEPFARLAAAGRLIAFRHEGFWVPMDTIKDMLMLEELYASGVTPWTPWLAGGWESSE